MASLTVVLEQAECMFTRRRRRSLQWIIGEPNACWHTTLDVVHSGLRVAFVFVPQRSGPHVNHSDITCIGTWDRRHCKPTAKTIVPQFGLLSAPLFTIPERLNLAGVFVLHVQEWVWKFIFLILALGALEATFCEQGAEGGARSRFGYAWGLPFNNG